MLLVMPSSAKRSLDKFVVDSANGRARFRNIFEKLRIVGNAIRKLGGVEGGFHQCSDAGLRFS